MFGSLKQNPVALGLGGLALLVLLSMSISIVPETKQAIISSYGQPLRVVNPYKPNQQFGDTWAGLTFRIPFVEQIQWVDKRVLSVSMQPQEVQSTDRRRLRVDAFARFRIVKPAKMYQAIRTEEALKAQLQTILESRLRNELGKRSFETLLSAERGAVMDNIQASLDREARKYGAQIIDVRIKRTDLPEGQSLQSAYQRMQSAQQQQAIAIDAEGQKEAQIIRAEADAKAAQIYAQSYGKDADFYDFYRSMQSYRRTFQQDSQNGDGNTTVVLSTDNDYLRNFRDGR
ncbi:MAG TPA: protease modulator HflC [Sphingorhabdus sp.]|uniref:protease modulator HflC n=1 Tax=Sphingorhabdus sp. TaxID=1902408 RepID=UPI002B8367C8|nr:protease modulator HflC [Sphingorhabdus sp.]HMT42232.1 protease modulator HflC [Sphingorhabdus sp.]HMU21645.1 protease modulator HflC [Sphingorhabdus sp.]